MFRKIVLVLVLGVVFLLEGLVPSWAQTTVTLEEVLAGKPLGATDDPTTSIEGSEVLALSDEMRKFLREHVNPGGTDVFRLQQLIDAIMGTTHIRLEYDENTRTAAETFRLQLGNCLSFTTMFVTLARGTGLKADFQEVDIPPDWTTRQDVFVLNRHVNIIVDVGSNVDNTDAFFMANGSKSRVFFKRGDFFQWYQAAASIGHGLCAQQLAIKVTAPGFAAFVFNPVANPDMVAIALEGIDFGVLNSVRTGVIQGHFELVGTAR